MAKKPDDINPNKFETGPISPGFNPTGSNFAPASNPDEEPTANWQSGEIDFSTLGTSGLKQFGGFVEEEWSPWLRGLAKIRVYREMEDNSSAVGAIRFLLRILMSQVDWYVEPPKGYEDSSEAKEICDFVEECREDMSHSWFDFVSEALSFLTYGFATFELVYKLRGGQATRVDKYGRTVRDGSRASKYDDNKVGWRKFAIRAQEVLLRWEFDTEDRSLAGFHTWDPYAGRGSFIPIEKAMLIRTEVTRDNPEGRSLYRSAYVDYKTLKRIQEVEAIGIEHDLTGMLKMQVPLELLVPNASPTNKMLRSQLERQLAALKRDERGFILVPPEVTADEKPTGYKLERMQSSGSHAVDTTRVKNYYRTNIMQSCLAQFLQLGQQDMAGAKALSSDHTDLFALGLYSMVDMMSAPVNRYAIPRLLAANEMPPELAPVVKHGDIEAPPLEEVSRFLMNLATAGVPFQSKELSDKLMDMASLPKPTDYTPPAGDMNNPAQPDPQDPDAPKKASAKEVDDLQQMRKFLLRKRRRRK